MKKERKECCICGKTLERQGNNPEPIRFNGECCDFCNAMYVVPARLKSFV